MAGAAAASALSVPSTEPPIGTSWCLPLEPSMMVTVFCSPGATCFAADFTAGSEVAGPVADFSPGVAGGSAMRTIGSPPNGLELKIAKPAKVTRNRPSRTASACMPVKGSRNRRLARAVFCPSGALRSSAVSAMDLPGNLARIRPREVTKPGQPARDPVSYGSGGRVRIAGFAARAAKRAVPRAALFDFRSDRRNRSVGLLRGGLVGDGRVVVGSLVAGSLVVGGLVAIGGGARIDLDAVQQVVGHFQRLVVLGVRRDVGLRAGLFLAAIGDLQMAAQRSLALGVGARLQFFRHVLHHLDV